MKKVLSIFDLIQKEDNSEFNFKPFWITVAFIFMVGLIVFLLF